MTRQSIAVVVLSLVVGFSAQRAAAEMITFETNFGTFVVETYDDTPVAVSNFIQYVEQGLLVDSFVHLSGTIPLVGGGDGSIIWGGQYTVDVNAGDIGNVNALAPVSEPSQATRSNTKYTITMAQTGAPSLQYTSGWFINMSDNTQLDGEQFTAWGEVVDGRDVLDTIFNLPTANLTSSIANIFGISGSFANVPFDNVNNDQFVDFDELVRITGLHMPEPTSLAVLALGSLAMLRRRTV